MPHQFAFVSADDSGRPKKTDRRLIRSHCMIGKNVREGSRRSVRRANQSGEASDPTLSFASAESTPEPDAEDVWDQVANDTTHPHPPLPDRSLFPGLDKILDQPTKDLIFTYPDSNTLRYLLQPIECFVDFRFRDPEGNARAMRDSAVQYSVLLSISGVNDFILKQPLTSTTHFYLRHTLSLLNQKLSEQDAHLHDSTVFVIMCLTRLSSIFHDASAAHAHLSGLQKIISLRGGDDYLRQDPMTHFKIDSVDLTAHLATGNPPQFLPDPIDWAPFYRDPLPDADESSSLLSLHDLPLDPRLRTAFEDLQHLTCLVNEHTAREARVAAAPFQAGLSSIRARTLRLREDGSADDKPLGRALAGAMLAFLATLFRIPGRTLPYRWLAAELAECVPTIETGDPVSRELVLWALMVLAISIVEPDEPWLRRAWRRVVEPGLEWGELGARLKRVAWFSCVQDEPGQKAFGELMAVEEEAPTVEERSEPDTQELLGLRDRLMESAIRDSQSP